MRRVYGIKGACKSINNEHYPTWMFLTLQSCYISSGCNSLNNKHSWYLMVDVVQMLT